MNKGHCTLSPKFSPAFFSSSFPIKMHATDSKTQKRRIFLWQTKVSEAESKRDWHNVRSYLFFNVQKFWTRLCMICCTFAYYCVYICVQNAECVHIRCVLITVLITVSMSNSTLCVRSIWMCILHIVCCIIFDLIWFDLIWFDLIWFDL